MKANFRLVNKYKRTSERMRVLQHKAPTIDNLLFTRTQLYCNLSSLYIYHLLLYFSNFVLLVLLLFFHYYYLLQILLPIGHLPVSYTHLDVYKRQGLWVAKFEASNSGGKIKVEPGVQSWRSITVNDIYTNLSLIHIFIKKEYVNCFFKKYCFIHNSFNSYEINGKKRNRAAATF